MTEPRPESAGKTPTTDTTRRKRRLNRRSILLALGAGSSVTLTGSAGSARNQEANESDAAGGDGSNGQQCPPCIDPYSGYLQVGATTDGDQQLGSIEPVATVELRVTGTDAVFPESEAADTEPPTNETAVEGPPVPDPSTGIQNETENGTPVPAPDAGNETIAGANETVGTGPQELPGFYFDPIGIHLRPGETVEFLSREGLHTVTAFHPRFGFQQQVPDGVPGFTSPPFLAEDSWYYRFDEPGVYDVLSLPDLGLGMVMRAVVVAEGEAVPGAYPEPDPAAGAPSIALDVLNAPELTPQHIVDQGTVARSELSTVAPSSPEEGE